MEKQGTLVPVDDLKPLYRLYFKGLVTEERTVLLAGFGVAICGDKDDLLFDTKRPIHDSTITLLEADLIALKCGLQEAVSMGISDISICCDDDQIFELVMGRSMPEHEKIVLLMRDVQDIMNYLTSSIPVLLTRNQAKFAYEFAIEAISSQVIIDIPALETCNICLNNDINADQIFSVDTCGDMFCSECVKRHIEMELHMRRSLIRCPNYHNCKLLRNSEAQRL